MKSRASLTAVWRRVDDSRQETHARQVAWDPLVCPPLVVPSGLMPDKLSVLPVDHQCYYHPGRQILAHSELTLLDSLDPPLPLESLMYQGSTLDYAEAQITCWGSLPQHLSAAEPPADTPTLLCFESTPSQQQCTNYTWVLAMTLRPPVSGQLVTVGSARGTGSAETKPGRLQSQEGPKLDTAPLCRPPAPTQPHSPAVTTQGQCRDYRLLPKAPEFPCHRMK